MRRTLAIALVFAGAAAAQYIAPGGGTGTGTQGIPGPVGTPALATVRTVSGSLSCTSDNLTLVPFSGTSLTVTLPTGCAANTTLIVINYSQTSPLAFNLSTNSVTVNGLSSLTALSSCASAGCFRYAFTMDSTGTNWLGVFGTGPAAAGGSPSFPANAQTATYQALAADFSACKTIPIASGTFAVTLVASTSQPASGQCLWLTNYGSGTITIARSGQNLNGGTASLSLPPGSAAAPTGAFIYSDGTNYFGQVFGVGSGSVPTNITTTVCPVPTTSATVTSTTVANAATCAIPQGLMGANSKLSALVFYKFVGGAGTRTLSATFSNTSGDTATAFSVFSGTTGGTNLGFKAYVDLMNNGTTSSQITIPASTGSTGAAPLNGTVNTGTATSYLNINCFVTTGDSCQVAALFVTLSHE